MQSRGDTHREVVVVRGDAHYDRKDRPTEIILPFGAEEGPVQELGSDALITQHRNPTVSWWNINIRRNTFCTRKGGRTRQRLTAFVFEFARNRILQEFHLGSVHLEEL